MAHLLYSILSGVGSALPEKDYPETLTAEGAVEILNQRFSGFFEGEKVLAKLSDGIVADAAAGGDKVKIKQGVMFPRGI
ncbi:MAG: DUF1704 domain-containing protein [Calothrix sp. SM1_5_4]|nr:DUF1704 domain-containing protein [Calothrix sp. SM1_5_4]